ncbi:endonuclease/exonuclease/phosphatase family protein [Demequina capsici]|uniref:Endonuclease/exonuclease/phosphatase family protein n=1 Tax=Demequina capsici TaxID=3075620 RepID=A0AA96FCH9_9MICO|nr:endonuclease/exonuclease/phosphatase family protein [Demequina sp. PMTSA13]WNM26957.1 endonuclease/exonuclease/phosphatase family protein [Demequina sp. PMTSA13]
MAAGEIDSHVVRHRRFRPPAPLGHRIGHLLALLATAALAVPFLARLTGIEPGPLAVLVALTPWFSAALLVPLVLALVSRAWGTAIAAFAMLAVGASWIIPLYTGGSDASPVLTVLTVNARLGLADADAIVDLADDRGVDVLAVEELTPGMLDDLEAAGIGRQFSYADAWPEPGVTGTGLWTRLPAQPATAVEGLYSRAVAAAVDVDGVTVTVLVAHPAAPELRDHGRWASDLDLLQGWVEGTSGPVLVLGDLNTTRDHAAFRALESIGLIDAADQAGSGIQATFPASGSPFPFVAIDHVLVRDVPFVATSTEAVTIPGTDHRAFVATYGAAEPG